MAMPVPERTTPRLPLSWSEFLVKQAETGMDYQIVAVTLRDGRVIEDVTIIGASLIGEVRGHDSVPFSPEEITEIKVTHRKWEFRR
jgi:hypothetical protein